MSGPSGPEPGAVPDAPAGRSGEVTIRTTRERRAADEGALVLVAEGLAPRVVRAAGGFRLTVPESQAARAERILDEYVRERRGAHGRARRGDEGDLGVDLGFGAVVGLALLCGFLAVRGPAAGLAPWYEAGRAEAGRLLGGEWWRAVTALTLHADLGHVLGNAGAGALFVGAVAGALGRGVGLLAVLLAGVLGNLLAAAVRVPEQASVGASTAVFGAVGVLGGLGLLRRRRQGLAGRRAWLPVVAGLALLAMLGMSPDTDLLAHATGFVAGLALGAALGAAGPPGAGAVVQAIAGASALALVLGAWTWAFAAAGPGLLR